MPAVFTRFRALIPLFAALVIAIALSVPSSSASRFVPYSAQAFAEAQQNDRTILVDVYATWCPTCKRQEPILEALATDPALEGVLAMRVDWDKDKAFLRAHRIPRQSTILVFKGTRETARSVAETNAQALRDVILAGVNAAEVEAN